MTNPPLPDSQSPTPLEPLTTQVSFKPSFGIAWLLGVVVLLSAGALFVTGKFKLLEGSPSPEEQIDDLKKGAEKDAAFSAAAESRIVQISWRKLQRQVEAAMKDHTDLSDTLNERTKRLWELEHSEEGRRIAAEETLLEQFAAVVNRPHPNSSQIAGWRQDADEITEVCKTALSSPSLLAEPSEKAIQHVEAMQQAIAQALLESRNDLTAITALAQSSAQNTPASVNLGEAMASREENRQRQRLAELTRDREMIRTQAEDQKKAEDLTAERKLNDEKLEQQRVANEMKITQERAKTKREQELLKETQDKLAAERAYQEKLKNFEKALPEIRSLLSPMISHGRMQIGGAGWIAGEEGPVSLDALKRSHILDLGEKGVYYVSGLFCGPSCRNDRPLGGFPESFTYQEAKIRRAQELLVEFGDILVEKEMLRP